MQVTQLVNVTTIFYIKSLRQTKTTEGNCNLIWFLRKGSYISRVLILNVGNFRAHLLLCNLRIAMKTILSV